MTYRDFVKRVMQESLLQRDDADMACKIVFKTIRSILLEGNEVRLPSLFSLKLHVTELSGPFIHPITKVEYERKPGVKIKIKPSRKFERMLTEKLLGAPPDTSTMSPEELEQYLLGDSDEE